jgi:hypothetical protein
MTDNFNPIIWAAFVSVPWGLFALWSYEYGKSVGRGSLRSWVFSEIDGANHKLKSEAAIMQAAAVEQDKTIDALFHKIDDLEAAKQASDSKPEKNKAKPSKKAKRK